jgi:hypothetical protein
VLQGQVDLALVAGCVAEDRLGWASPERHVDEYLRCRRSPRTLADLTDEGADALVARSRCSESLGLLAHTAADLRRAEL